MAQAGTTSLTKWPSTRAGNDDDGDSNNDDNNDQDDDNDDDEDDENDAALRAPANRLLRRPLRNGCATPATSPRNRTHVLVHWESFLQGSVIPATELARADPDIRAEQPLRAARTIMVAVAGFKWLHVASRLSAQGRAVVRRRPARPASLVSAHCHGRAARSLVVP